MLRHFGFFMSRKSILLINREKAIDNIRNIHVYFIMVFILTVAAVYPAKLVTFFINKNLVRRKFIFEIDTPSATHQIILYYRLALIRAFAVCIYFSLEWKHQKDL